jgi:hypothetical protein
MSEMGKTAVLAALKKADAAKDRLTARRRTIPYPSIHSQPTASISQFNISRRIASICW